MATTGRVLRQLAAMAAAGFAGAGGLVQFDRHRQLSRAEGECRTRGSQARTRCPAGSEGGWRWV